MSVGWPACAPNPADDVPAARVEAVGGKSASAQDESGAVDEAVTYVVAPGSEIGFVGSKVTGKQEGGFHRFEGRFAMDGDRLAGDDNRVVIDMTSLWSDDDRLTKHLASPDFFDVAKYPNATFVLTSVGKTAENRYTVHGRLTFHGVTKEVSFPATIERKGDEGRLRAEFSINRFDFDVRYPGRPDDLIREEVVIKLDLAIERAGA